jgi:hypothetical protein
MNTPEQQLSESLLAACKAAGIEKPICIVQGHSGAVYHTPYISKPTDAFNGIGIMKLTRINHQPYADHWKDSLLEWVEPQEMLPTVFIPHEGEPLVDVLARHPDTSKKVDDAIRIGYHKHVVNGDGLYFSRANDYRQGWQDALAWKGGSHE